MIDVIDLGQIAGRIGDHAVPSGTEMSTILRMSPSSVDRARIHRGSAQPVRASASSGRGRPRAAPSSAGSAGPTGSPGRAAGGVRRARRSTSQCGQRATAWTTVPHVAWTNSRGGPSGARASRPTARGRRAPATAPAPSRSGGSRGGRAAPGRARGAAGPPRRGRRAGSVSTLRDISSRAWKSSKRRMPRNASRRISSVQRSPTTSSAAGDRAVLLAVGAGKHQRPSRSRVRCIELFDYDPELMRRRPPVRHASARWPSLVIAVGVVHGPAGPVHRQHRVPVDRARLRRQLQRVAVVGPERLRDRVRRLPGSRRAGSATCSAGGGRSSSASPSSRSAQPAAPPPPASACWSRRARPGGRRRAACSRPRSGCCCTRSRPRRGQAPWAPGPPSGAIAAASGPPLGGLLVEVDWRLIFLVNLPLAAGALLASRRVSRRSATPRTGGLPDLLGIVAARRGHRRARAVHRRGAAWGWASSAFSAASAALALLGAVPRGAARSHPGARRRALAAAAAAVRRRQRGDAPVLRRASARCCWAACSSSPGRGARASSRRG